MYINAVKNRCISNCFQTIRKVSYHKQILFGSLKDDWYSQCINVYIISVIVEVGLEENRPMLRRALQKN
jgi:hypothetical protein